MLFGDKSREDLNAHAEKLFATNENVVKQKLRRELYDQVAEKFGLTISRIEEMILFKKDIKEFSPFEVFAVVWFLDRDCLGKYFTENEIQQLSEYKQEKEQAQFPLIFDNMVQITSDQWIGKVTVKQLMAMRNSRLLNYDPNEQRALRRVKFGKEEVYKPFVSNKNVKEIRALMENGKYIPDPITLNMPEGAEFSFDKGILTVYSLPNGMFNLDDGYHRYLAMIQIYDFDNEFDYPMELRIVNFSNVKANNFIFQQDQKTPMKRVVSDTYNMESIPNRIVTKLNEDPLCNINGMIGRNKAQINAAVLVKLVSYFYDIKNIKREDAARSIINIEKELRQKFNLITEQNDRFLGVYSEVMIFTVVYVFNSNTNPAEYADRIIAVIDGISPEEEKLFNISTIGAIRKRALNILAKKLGEIGG